MVKQRIMTRNYPSLVTGTMLVALVMILGACDSPQELSTTSPSVAPVPIPPGVAVLDWETATITLPLDRYGMSPRESQAVEAASSIEWAHCVDEAQEVTTSVLEEASRYLGIAPMTTHWLYGSWDAPYIARFGWRRSDPPLSFVETDPGTAQECWARIHDAGLDPLREGTAMDEVGTIIALGSQEAYDQTMADPAFHALQGQWRDCVASAGYVIDTDDSTSAAQFEDSWSEEQILEAWLADAKCADDMGYTQQVANINAAYQMEYIREHEAELVEVKRIADERVAKATQILKDAGVL